MDIFDRVILKGKTPLQFGCFDNVMQQTDFQRNRSRANFLDPAFNVSIYRSGFEIDQSA
jgi:hypothetical protein